MTRHRDSRRTVWTICVACDEPFLQRPGRPARCSVMCSQAHRRGSDHYFHKGGLAFEKTQRRWRIMCRDGTQTTFARAVMEAKMKRPLTSREIVHHDNEDSTDDREENLRIVTRRQHLEIHRQRRTAIR